jgi:hypothetical protein
MNEQYPTTDYVFNELGKFIRYVKTSEENADTKYLLKFWHPVEGLAYNHPNEALEELNHIKEQYELQKASA